MSTRHQGASAAARAAHWCTLGLSGAEPRSGAVSDSPKPCRDDQLARRSTARVRPAARQAPETATDHKVTRHVLAGQSASQ